jgi:hypothetical protein
MLPLRDMSKPAVNIGIALLGALASASAVVWTLAMYQRPPHALDRSLMWWGTLLASGGLIYCWSTVVGHLSRTRIWSPQWTFLTGGLPFYIVALWFFFFSPFAFGFAGGTRMLLMEFLGIISGQLARKAAYPQFSDKESPNADLPPPTLFPK